MVTAPAPQSAEHAALAGPRLLGPPNSSIHSPFATCAAPTNEFDGCGWNAAHCDAECNNESIPGESPRQADSGARSPIAPRHVLLSTSDQDTRHQLDCNIRMAAATHVHLSPAVGVRSCLTRRQGSVQLQPVHARGTSRAISTAAAEDCRAEDRLNAPCIRYGSVTRDVPCLALLLQFVQLGFKLIISASLQYSR